MFELHQILNTFPQLDNEQLLVCKGDLTHTFITICTQQ